MDKVPSLEVNTRASNFFSTNSNSNLKKPEGLTTPSPSSSSLDSHRLSTPTHAAAVANQQDSSSVTTTTSSAINKIRFKNMVRKVRSVEQEEAEIAAEEAAAAAALKASINAGSKGTPIKGQGDGSGLPQGLSQKDRSIRQKHLFEDERLGKAKSLGFNSIKAGLSYREYEEFILKSPLKPLINKFLPPPTSPGTSLAGGGGDVPENKRRSILVRMKTETSSFSGVLLPPLQQGGSGNLLGNNNSNGVGGVGGNGSLVDGGSSITSVESAGAGAIGVIGGGGGSLSGSLLVPGSGRNSRLIRKSFGSRVSGGNDDYSKDEFEDGSSLESAGGGSGGGGGGNILAQLSKVRLALQEEEEKMAKAADDTKDPAIAPFLLFELQSEHLIDRRFGWRRKDRSEGNGGIDPSISKSTSDQEIVFKPKKLGELTPTGSMRQMSIRAGLGMNPLKQALSSVGGPGKLTRKATMANLVAAQNATAPAVTSVPTDPSENSETAVFQHYSGLLYRDPQVLGTWSDCNTPKKTKASLFQTTKTTLSAGRNMNAYRPWGPPRPIDPLDAILEKTMTSQSAELEEYDDDEDRPRSRDDHRKGRKRSHSGSKNNRNQHKSRSKDRPGRRSSSPSTSPRSGSHRNSRAHTPDRKGSAGSRSKSRDGSRANSASRPHSRGNNMEDLNGQSSPSRPLAISVSPDHSPEASHFPDTSQITMENSTTHSPSQNIEDLHRSESPEGDNSKFSPPNSRGVKKRSPLLINYVKPNLLM